jgi:putative ABC transport system permease protein
VQLWETHRGDVSSQSEASYPDFLDWRRERDLFAALEGYDETNVTVSDASGAEMVMGSRVTSGFFRMLGVSPRRGRSFGPEDDVSGGTRAVILSHGFWTRRFGANPDVVGRSVTIDGVPYEIRGVLPAQFSYAPVGDAAVWLPIGRSAETRAQRFNHWVRVVGRLRDGVTVDAARHRMADVMRTLAAQYPESNSGRGVLITPLPEVVRAGIERPVLVLFGAVGIVLLIACANVATLVLARSIERGREIAVRSAIGASRGRLLRQLLTENLVLALAGAVLGAWVAKEGVRLLVAAVPEAMFSQMPSLREASVDGAALGFTIAVAIGTGIIFGLAPAVLSSRRSAAELLRSDSRAGTGRARHRLRDALVMSEIALTLVLLVGATLMGRSLLALLRVDPGFTAERVATVRAALAGPSYADGTRQQLFFEELLPRVRSLPGVEAVGAISSPPLQGGGTNTFHVDGAPEPPPASRPEATTRAVAGDYFSALRIPLIEGRALSSHDDLKAPYAVVISESAARRLFGARSAVGERLRFYAWQDSAWTIVGVVGDVKTDALDAPAAATIYYSHLQGPANRMSIVARTAGADPSALIPAMRREVQAMDPKIAVYAASTMVERIERSQAVYSRRYLLVLLGSFAAAALLLAIIGVYGVIAYAVTQRTREIAIRIALGARSREVLTLVLRSGLRLVAAGIAVGAVAALALSRTLSSLLFGVHPADVWTYGLASLLLVLVAVAASYVPARRATRFDPAMALRSE